MNITHQLEYVVFNPAASLARARWNVTLSSPGGSFTFPFTAPAIQRGLDVEGWRDMHLPMHPAAQFKKTEAIRTEWLAMEKRVAPSVTDGEKRFVLGTPNSHKTLLKNAHVTSSDRRRVWASESRTRYQWEIAVVYPVAYYVGPNHLNALSVVIEEAMEVYGASGDEWWQAMLSDFGPDGVTSTPFATYNTLQESLNQIRRVFNYQLDEFYGKRSENILTILQGMSIEVQYPGISYD